MLCQIVSAKRVYHNGMIQLHLQKEGSEGVLYGHAIVPDKNANSDFLA